MKATTPTGEEFLYIDIDSIDNETNILLPKKLKTKLAPSRARRYTQIGDTLFSMVRPYLRNIAQVEQDHCIASTGFFVCNPYGNICKHYIYYMMLSDYVVSGLNQFMRGDNSPSINSNNIENWSFPIPPVTEQKRIVDRVNKMFALIDAAEQEKRDLKATVYTVKTKILDLALSGRLTSHTSHYQQLPEGWELKALGDIGRWQSGGTPTRSNKAFYNGNIPWLKIADLNNGYIEQTSEHISEDGLKNSSAKLNPANSVCVGMYGSIGKAGILSFPATTNQAICVCSNLRGITSEFLFYYIVSQRKHLISKAGGGVQANISKEIIIKYQIPLPPMEEQLRIIKEIHQYSSIIDRINSLL